MTELFEDNTGNVATIILLVPSVAESHIERYITLWVICHQNAAYYSAFQHATLQSLRKEDEERFNELEEKRFGLTECLFNNP